MVDTVRRNQLDVLESIEGGKVKAVTVTPTITSGSAYASGNSVGGLLTFTGLVRTEGCSGLIQNVTLTVRSGLTPEIDLVLFKDIPSASTITDKTAVAIANADLDKIIGTVKLKDYIALGTPSLVQASQLALAYDLADGLEILYGVLIVRGTPNFSSTAGVTLTIGAVLD